MSTSIYESLAMNHGERKRLQNIFKKELPFLSRFNMNFSKKGILKI